MRTIIGSSGGDCVLMIVFQIYGSKAGLFESNFYWVGQCDPPLPPSTLVLEEELTQYQYNLIQFSSNQSKIILSLKTANIIL